MALCQSKGDGF